MKVAIEISYRKSIQYMYVATIEPFTSCRLFIVDIEAILFNVTGVETA